MNIIQCHNSLALPPAVPLWIGAMKDSDGHFTYLNGMWMKGKHSFENRYGDKNCVAFNAGGVEGRYANFNCDEKKKFVCQVRSN